MNAAAYVGRVGGLAVVLGVGAAVITGYGSGLAWAETPSSGSSSTSTSTSDSGGSASDDSGSATDTSSEPTNDDGAEADAGSDPEDEAGAEDESDDETETEPESDETEPETDDDTEADAADDTEPGAADDTEPGAADDSEPGAADDSEPGATEADPEDIAEKETGGSERVAELAADAPEPTTTLDASEVQVGADEQTATESVPFSSFAAQMVSPTIAESSAEVSTTLTPPPVPSLRLWPTAFDPGTAVTYVTGLVSSLVSAALSPFAAGAPALPAEPPTLWTLLAWVRREFFNSSPTISPVINQQTNGLITGNVGAADADGDQLTYTVIGRPLNGGVVEVDDEGNFTYRPMNAMAAVGGTDSFVVVVDDEAAGLHINGPLGLLQFVPIVGNLLYPGGGHRVAETITVNVEPVEGVDLSFPDDFHWGVAHSGFQAEGGPGSPVDPNSDWYKWVHDPINQLLGLTRGVPDDGPGTYVRYDTDAELASDELGMNTFRMGIEWSRIFPSSTASIDISDDGGVVTLEDLEALDALANQDEVEHYRDVLASLRAHGLEPMVTVNHFTLPSWVNDPTTARLLVQLGLPAPAAGWLSPSTPVEFEKYAAYLAWKYGDQVDNWAVLNEPVPPILTQYLSPPIPGSPIPYWPPGVVRPDLASTFLVNEAKGYVAAYDAIHAWDNTVATAGQPEAFVGFTNNMIPARPANPVNPLDVQAADAWNTFYNYWFPNAVIDGWVDANLDGIETPDEIHPEMMNKVDFLGVQYYGSQPIQGFGLAPVPGFPWLQGLPVQCSASSPDCSDFNQPTDPGGFREVLEIAASYGKPIWVTENGIADANDSKRPSYIANHIAVVQDLVAHGTDIRGYTYWSFVDNLEWAHGYDLKFGLYGSDPTTPELERTPKPDSIGVISGITGVNALPTSLLELYIPGAM